MEVACATLTAIESKASPCTAPRTPSAAALALKNPMREGVCTRTLSATAAIEGSALFAEEAVATSNSKVSTLARRRNITFGSCATGPCKRRRRLGVATTASVTCETSTLIAFAKPNRSASLTFLLPVKSASVTPSNGMVILSAALGTLTNATDSCTPHCTFVQEGACLMQEVWIARAST
jgi:hypothetical protein